MCLNTHIATTDILCDTNDRGQYTKVCSVQTNCYYCSGVENTIDLVYKDRFSGKQIGNKEYWLSNRLDEDILWDMHKLVKDHVRMCYKGCLKYPSKCEELELLLDSYREKVS